MSNWREYAKAIVAIATQAITQIVALGLLSGSAATTAQIIGAVITAAVVYQVPNARPASV